jgi:hypothetical protein
MLSVSALLAVTPAGAAGPRLRTLGSKAPGTASGPPAPASAVLGGISGLLGSLPGTELLPTTAKPGYRLASAAGRVGAYGGTPFYGSLASSSAHAPVVGLAATPDGHGYWLVASDGGVFSFGDAVFYGSAGGTSLDAPVVGITATSDGHGYWLVASDGGVFAFGDAAFYGSLATSGSHAPVVGITATRDGHGYWIVGSDGGVFSFGDAPFYGSAGGTPLDAPVVGITATPDGHGYWLASSDGGVFSFGGAVFYGSAGGTSLDAPVVGITGSPDGRGYWLVASDGGVFSFGDAPFRGSGSGDVPTGDAVTAIVSGAGTNSGTSASGDFIPVVLPTGTPYPHAAFGFDISFPQCHKTYPVRSAVAVVGANNGSAFTTNPCFASEAAWAGPNLTVYLNLNSPQGSDPTEWTKGPDGNCASGDSVCDAYNYGFNAAQHSIAMVHSAGFHPNTWWLDVETTNHWSTDTQANDAVISGMIAAIRLSGGAPAIYSTNYQWGQIAGDYVPNLPAWYATGIATFFPQHWCSKTSFAGGPVYLVQGRAGSFDGAYEC